MNYSDVIKGALLHDIGKFIMRGQKASGKTHQEIGFEWLTKQGIPNSVAEFAARHHKVKKNNPKYKQLDAFELPLNDILIVYEADNLSSGERLTNKKNSGTWQNDTPLMSVFSKLSLHHRADKPQYNNCWLYHPLGTGEVLSFPGELQENLLYTPEKYQDIFKQFAEEFNKLLPELPLDALLMLLEKYTARIPSETLVQPGKPESHPDISLFDHLKTTAAITACLYKYMKETYPNYEEKYFKEEILNRQEKRYMLVGGDFSGVQKFIYTISSKGALKTLRARSFFLELMTEHVISQLLTGMDLPRVNIIYSGGGKLYLLAPNTPSCKEVVEKVAYRVNDYLFNQFNGQLYLALDTVAFSGQTFQVRDKKEDTPQFIDIGQVWAQLKKRLTYKKNRKFAEQMNANPQKFWQPQEPQEKSCAICHTESDQLVSLTNTTGPEEQIEVCQFCKQLYRLGDSLPKTKFIACTDQRPEKNLPFITINHLHYVLLNSLDELGDISPSQVLVINSWSVKDYSHPRSVQMLTGNYFAKDQDRFKSFDHLATEAVGDNRIAVLRMDVDNLGTLFTRGLHEQERTFSRLATLSRNLTSFFKYYINGICSGNLKGSLKITKKQYLRNVTIVYAGGDDLFIVGGWDDVVEVAFDVQKFFTAYTGDNPDVTISGGITVQSSKYPLYRLAEIAGSAEELAKDNGRDSISLFYSPRPDFYKEGIPVYTGTFKWQQARELLNEIIMPAVDLLGAYDSRENRVKFDFSKAFIYKLLAVADIWRREGKLYLPRLAYILARETEHIKRRNKGKLTQWEDWKRKIYDTRYISSLSTVVTWLDLLSRRGEASNEQ